MTRCADCNRTTTAVTLYRMSPARVQGHWTCLDCMVDRTAQQKTRVEIEDERRRGVHLPTEVPVTLARCG